MTSLTIIFPFRLRGNIDYFNIDVQIKHYHSSTIIISFTCACQHLTEIYPFLLDKK